MTWTYFHNLAILPISNTNIVLTRLIAGICEKGNIKKTSGGFQRYCKTFWRTDLLTFYPRENFYICQYGARLANLSRNF